MNCVIENDLNSIKKHLQRYLNYTLKDLNIKSAEMIFLRVLWGMENTSQIEVARKLDCDKSHIHRLTCKLLEKELIYFPENYIDKTRNNILKLTEKGKEIINRVNLTIETWLKKITSGIDKNEIDIFKKVIAKITQNANQISTETEK